MRRFVTAAVFFAAVVVLPYAAECKGVQFGREYMKLQRQLDQRKKALAVEEREIAGFETLIKQIKALQIPEDSKELLARSSEARWFMERAHREAIARLADAPGSDDADTRRHQEADIGADGPAEAVDENTKAKLVQRMAGIIREVSALEHWISAGETDVVPRHRYLLSEFAVVMRESLEERTVAVERDEKDLQEGRWE